MNGQNIDLASTAWADETGPAHFEAFSIQT